MLRPVHLTIAAVLLCAASALAGAPSIEKRPSAEASKFEIESEVGYVAPSEFTGSVDAGKISTLNAKLNVKHTLYSSRQYTLRLRTSVDAFWFDLKDSAGVTPNQFTNLGIGLGGDYRFADAYQLTAEFVPKFSFGEAGSGDFTYSAILAIGRKFSDRLLGIAGVLVQPDFEFPVIPVAGFIWKISDEWTFNATFPRGSIVYSPSERWEFLGLVQLKTGDYRTPGDFAKDSERNDLGNDWLSYMDVQVGVGVNYKVCKGFKVGVQTGASVYRQFEFDSADFDIEGDPAPFVSVGVTSRF